MKKTFDCVQMKWDIQQKLMKEYEGLSLVDRKVLMEKAISDDPILGPWMERARRESHKQAMVAETRSKYGTR